MDGGESGGECPREFDVKVQVPGSRCPDGEKDSELGDIDGEDSMYGCVGMGNEVIRVSEASRVSRLQVVDNPFPVLNLYQVCWDAILAAGYSAAL